jgi:hypothetical protein
MPEPRALRVLGGYLGILAAGAALVGAPPLVVFLLGYAVPAGIWVLSVLPAPAPGREHPS